MKASLGCSFVWINFSFHSACFWWWYIYFIFIRVKLFDDFKFANIKYFDEYLTDILSTNLMVVTRSLCVVISDDKIVSKFAVEGAFIQKYWLSMYCEGTVHWELTAKHWHWQDWSGSASASAWPRSLSCDGSGGSEPSTPSASESFWSTEMKQIIWDHFICLFLLIFAHCANAK